MRTDTDIAAALNLKGAAFHLLFKIITKRSWPTNKFQEEMFDIVRAMWARITVLETQHELAAAQLRSVSIDCQMALSGSWDKGAEGFRAMLGSVNDTLNIMGVKPPVETSEVGSS